jgi:hypothetical protein
MSGDLAEAFGADVKRSYRIVDEYDSLLQQYMQGACSQCSAQAPPLHIDPADGNIYCSTCWEKYYGKGTAPSNHHRSTSTHPTTAPAAKEIGKTTKKGNSKGQALDLGTLLSGGGGASAASAKFQPRDPSKRMPKPKVVGCTNYFSLLDCDDSDDDHHDQHEPKQLVQQCKIPTIKFLNSWLVELVDATGSVEFVSVEEKLDGKWTKWNSNSGMVARYGKGVEQNEEGFFGSSAAAAAWRAALKKDDFAKVDGGKVGTLMMDPDSDSGVRLLYSDGTKSAWVTVSRLTAAASAAEKDARSGRDIPTANDVPQAFSHWTSEKTGGKHLVCDLQGVFESEKNQYSMSDPVIHSEWKGTYGRTDRGLEGIKAFFKSHKCNALCRKLGLSPNARFDPSTMPAATSVTSQTRSRNTSAFTVMETNHLKLRQTQRQIHTRDLQAAVKYGKKKLSRKDGGTTRIIHEHEGIEYITDKTGKVGITGYRKD